MDPNKNDSEGYLEKLGHLVKNWKRRYFVLRQHSQSTSPVISSPIPKSLDGSSSRGKNVLISSSTKENKIVENESRVQKDSLSMNSSSNSTQSRISVNSVDLQDPSRDSSIDEGDSERSTSSSPSLAPSDTFPSSVSFFDQEQCYFLDYYATHQQGELLGSITVTRARLVQFQRDIYEEEKRKYMFGLTPPNSARTYLLNSSSQQERQKWLTLLQQSGALYQGMVETPKVSESSVKEGYLTKKGLKIRSWQKRFFIFESNGNLHYYKNHHTSKSKGTIVLSAQSRIEKHKEKAQTFIITPEPSGRRYLVRAVDDETTLSWMVALYGWIRSNRVAL